MYINRKKQYHEEILSNHPGKFGGNHLHGQHAYMAGKGVAVFYHVGDDVDLYGGGD